MAPVLGTQLAPEDLIGVPQIHDGRSRFCPPEMIARDKPYCLFLDELYAAPPDVQKCRAGRSARWTWTSSIARP